MDRLLIAPLVRFLRDESGPTAVEYAVMLALIICVVIGGILQVSNEADNMYGDINNDLAAHGF
jgi:pilus assembly protein Flp/PilA